MTQAATLPVLLKQLRLSTMAQLWEPMLLKAQNEQHSEEGSQEKNGRYPLGGTDFFLDFLTNEVIKIWVKGGETTCLKFTLKIGLFFREA